MLWKQNGPSIWPSFENMWCENAYDTATELLIDSAAAKSLQSCPTLCDPIDGSPPGSAIPGILQARKLEWAAISLSNVWKWKVKVKSFSPAWLVATPWTTTHQAPLSMGFSRQEYWSGVPLSTNNFLFLFPSIFVFLYSWQQTYAIWIVWKICYLNYRVAEKSKHRE